MRYIQERNKCHTAVSGIDCMNSVAGGSTGTGEATFENAKDQASNENVNDDPRGSNTQHEIDQLLASYDEQDYNDHACFDPKDPGNVYATNTHQFSKLSQCPASDEPEADADQHPTRIKPAIASKVQAANENAKVQNQPSITQVELFLFWLN